MFSWFKKEASGHKKVPFWLLALGALVGVAMILWGGTSSPQKAEEAEPTAPIEQDLTRYQEYLEKRVKMLCESAGFGGISAVVTLESGFESVYATELVDGNEEYVIFGSGSNAQALLLSQNAPPIMGIGIVCRTPLSESARAELIELISASFHTPTNRIHVTIIR